VKPDEKTLISPLLRFGGRREGELTPTVHEILSVKRDYEVTSATQLKSSQPRESHQTFKRLSAKYNLSIKS